MWFSVVYSFIDNDTRHHSGQNVVDSRGHAKPQYHNIKETKSLSWQLNTPTRIWKCARCIMQMSCLYASDRLFQKLLQTRLICRTIRKNSWEKSNDSYSLSIRVHTTKNHISIYFLPQYQRQRKFFFQSVSWKRHCMTHWREQRGRGSYLPR